MTEAGMWETAGLDYAAIPDSGGGPVLPSSAPAPAGSMASPSNPAVQTSRATVKTTILAHKASASFPAEPPPTPDAGPGTQDYRFLARILYPSPVPTGVVTDITV